VPGTEVIGINQLVPHSHIRTSLNLDKNETVWEVYRRRLANGEPISLQRAFFPVKLMPDLNKLDLSGSFFQIWRGQYNLEPKDGIQTIRTRAATEEEASLLMISVQAPIFEITRITCDINNRPFEYLISLWRGDRYDLNVRLSSI
jgi:GntR family transcriptional regulator